MEMHIVNLSPDASEFKAAVIGILFNVDESLTEPTFADKFLQTLLNSTDSQSFQKDFLDHLNFNKRFVFRGSLTTPPYTEGLLWTVLPEVVKIQQETIDLFQKQFEYMGLSPIVGEPNRSVQPLNDRDVYQIDIPDETWLME